MKITIICEGRTEAAFKESLLGFLTERLAGNMPKIRFDVQHGAIPQEGALRTVVQRLLHSGSPPSNAVIALTDVYPKFQDAESAKQLMRDWVGEEPQFFPHVALHDFEAWLLPFWNEICKLAGKRAQPPGKNPERVDHGNPPSRRLAELFETGTCRKSYRKPRDAKRILRDQDLGIAIASCPELKAMVNTIIKLCDESSVIP